MNSMPHVSFMAITR